MKTSEFGNYYENFNIGETINHWPGKTITESPRDCELMS